MKTLKKITAVLLSCTVLMTLSAPAVFAGTDECKNCPTIVIPGVFQSDVRYYDDNGNEMTNASGDTYSKPFFAEDTDTIVKDALENALWPIARLLITQHDKDEKAATAIADVLGRSLFSNIALDEHGNIIKNIKATEYNTSLANLSAEDRAYCLNQIPLQDYVNKVGLDHLYFLSYVSTGSIKQTAERLFALIQTAKTETGHDKVNLLPISQGGSIFNALMQLYRDKGLEFSDDVNRVCFIVPAADGAAVLGDIYHYGFLDDDEALYEYMFPSLLDDDQQYLAYLINIILRIFPNGDLNNILDKAVDTLIEDYLENSTCLWALIPSKDYPDCRAKFLSDDDSKYIVQETDWYYNAQLNHRSYILEEQQKGVEFFDIVDYNYELYKICDSWDKVNADGIIHTDSESFGATSVAVNKSLADDYVQANTYCSDSSHNHIDEARLVDASTGILCETTFYFKGQDHEKTASNDVIIRLAIRILTDESFKNVYSDSAYPQFNYARNSRSFISDINDAKNIDRSTLSAENAAKLDEIIARAESVADSTYMTTEDFNSAVDSFYADRDAVLYGNSGEEESENKLLAIVTKILKWYSNLLYKLFKGFGWSDILLFRNFNCGGK